MGWVLAKDEAHNKEADSKDKHPGEERADHDVHCIGGLLSGDCIQSYWQDQPPHISRNSIYQATHCEVLGDFRRYRYFNFFSDGDV